MCSDVVAVVSVFDQRSPTAFIFCVRETRNEHASGQGIRAVRSNGAAGGFLEVADGLHQFRLRRIGVHIEDKDAAIFKTGEPEMTPVIGETAVVRLIASLDGKTADDFVAVRRA